MCHRICGSLGSRPEAPKWCTQNNQKRSYKLRRFRRVPPQRAICVCALKIHKLIFFNLIRRWFCYLHPLMIELEWNKWQISSADVCVCVHCCLCCLCTRCIRSSQQQAQHTHTSNGRKKESNESGWMLKQDRKKDENKIYATTDP